MKKTLSIMLILLLSFSAALGSSCQGKKEPNTVVVQSTYNNLKVMQEGEYIALGQKINVVTHKGDRKRATYYNAGKRYKQFCVKY